VCSPDSKLLVAAQAELAGVARIVVERFTTQGTLDLTFAKGNGAAVLGPVRTPAGDGVLTSATPGHKLTVDAHGRPVVGLGRTIERLNPDGTPDTTFGVGGTITLPADTQVVDLVATAQNGVLALVNAAGAAQLNRYTSSGTPDTAFGTKGVVAVPGTTQGSALTLTRDGKIAVVGEDAAGRASVTLVLDVVISPPVVIIRPALVGINFNLSAPEAVGILVQRRRHGRWVKVGRVPFGRRHRGHDHIHWRLRVNGRRLPPGLYRFRVRLLDGKGRVFEVSKPFRLRVT
jgi:uncharacterized delta-60 repeat protein